LSKTASVCFLLDVDNTLLDNDGVKKQLDQMLLSDAGEQTQNRFWTVYEQVRSDLGAVSVPVTLERLRSESPNPTGIDRLGQRLFSAPFRDYVYPATPELLLWMRKTGVPVILSDGDPWFQAKKITDAGLGTAVGGNVLIFLHKEQHVQDIRKWYPADRYIAVDDKAQLLAELKSGFGECMRTLWVRQGHYASDANSPKTASPDAAVGGISEARAVIERLLLD
jgi:hypothetical protein